MSSHPLLPMTLIDLLRASAASVPDNAAILTPGRPDLTYTALLRLVEHSVGILNGFGLKPGSRVLVMIPNGAELATAFMVVASGFVAVLLNPDYKAEEVEFYLTQSKAEALLVAKHHPTLARAVAQAHGVRVVELVTSPGMPTGCFDIEGGVFVEPTFNQPDDVAFFLTTSGTTGRSKLVPYVSWRFIDGILRCDETRNQTATPDIPCFQLNPMPLFHLFGLTSVVRPLMHGWGVICGWNFTVEHFFTLADRYGAIWACIAPAMMTLLVEEAPAYADIIGRYALRNINTGSAPLTAELADAVESALHVGILQVFGMTEVPDIAISITNLPGRYKPGSVGKAVIDVAIMADDNSLLPPNQMGEIVLHADHIFIGYEGNPEASAAMYRDGWFCTGDAGYFDDDGFLFVKGRLKEIINRGGEKVSPYEVEAQLLRHPAIREAAVFGVPHPLLGEDVAAAVVISDPALTSRQVRSFAAQHLAPQHVPGAIFIVSEIPKTAVGKPQRRALPGLLGLDNPDGQARNGRRALAPPPAPPRTEVEQKLAALWEDVLRIPEIGIHDEFFDLGGTSLAAAQLVVRVDQEFRVMMPISTLFESSTIAEMAALLTQEDNHTEFSGALPIQVGGDKPPLFCVPGILGQGFGFRALAAYLGVDQPVYSLRMPGSEADTSPLIDMMTLATHLTEVIRSVQPQGPYQVIGYSFGGLVALEIARNLSEQGEQVALLGVLDTSMSFLDMPLKKSAKRVLSLRRRFHRLRRHLRYLMMRQLASIPAPFLSSPRGVAKQELPAYIDTLRDANTDAMTTYRPKPYAGDVVYFSTRQTRQPKDNPYFEPSWQEHVLGRLEICDIPGNHNTLLSKQYVPVLAGKLKEHLVQTAPAWTPAQIPVSLEENA